MNVAQVQKELSLKILTMPSPDKEITGGYTGDLLSWVMGRVNEGDAWITIMSNINIVAVASLADVSCVIIAEGVTLDDTVTQTAMSKGINILSTELPSFEIALRLGGLLA